MKKILLAGLLSMTLYSAFSQNTWKLNGNAGTAPGDFLGTTDSKPILFKTNNTERGQLTASGLWRFGSSTNNYTFPSTDGLSGQVLKTNGSGTLSWSNDLSVGGADVYLSNLSSPTAVNQSLLPGVDNSIDLGSSVASWKDVYFGDALFHNGQKFISAPGLYNTAIGINSLMSNPSGALNTGVGAYSLYNNTTGYENTGIGYFALHATTTGEQNVAVGGFALANNTTGGGNISIGASMYSNTTGYNNIGIGVWSLYYETGAVYNVGVGTATLQMNTDGWQNTAVGYVASPSNTSGLRNASFGAETLIGNETGSYISALGYGANVAAPDYFNATAIGATALVDASDKVRVGNTTVTSIGGEVSWTTFSDARYKTNIKENVPGLDFINSLRPITYTVNIHALNGHYPKNKRPEFPSQRNPNTQGQDFDEDAALTDVNARINQSEDQASKIIYTGFTAQEVEAAAKKLNYEFSGVDKPKTENGLYGLRYSDFVVPLVKAVQEVSAELKSKDDLITSQQQQIDDLKQELQEIKNLLSKKGISNSTFNSAPVVKYAAVLDQNAPNPFNQVTTIRYELPERFSSAKIVVYDMKGSALKEINVSGTGKGMLTIDGSVFPAGTYNYSLFIDQQLMATKQMILTK